MVVYGVNLFAAAMAFLILQTLVIRAQGAESALNHAVGSDAKGKVSPVLYLAGVGCALLGHDHSNAWIYAGLAGFVVVAILWLIPDRRIERTVNTDDTRQQS